MDYVQKSLREPEEKSPSLIRSCNGIYFNIYGTSFNQLDEVSVTGSSKTSHIMISYQWDVQPTMKKVIEPNKHIFYFKLRNLYFLILNYQLYSFNNTDIKLK